MQLSGSSEKVSEEPKCTLFIGNLPFKYVAADLSNFLKKSGVKDFVGCRVCFDKRGRSKGFGYVDFNSEDTHRLALASLEDSEIEGRRLKVDAAEAARKGGPSAPVDGAKSVFMKNLAFTVSQTEIVEYVSRELELDSNLFKVKLIRFIDGKSRGFGQIDFQDGETAQLALRKLNGLLWKDRQIQVQRFDEHSNDGKVLRRSVFLGSLRFDSTASSIAHMINDVMGGDVVTNVRLGMDRFTNEFMGFAHVDFIDSETTFRAAHMLNGYVFKNRRIRADISENRAASWWNQQLQQGKQGVDSHGGSDSGFQRKYIQRKHMGAPLNSSRQYE